VRLGIQDNEAAELLSHPQALMSFSWSFTVIMVPLQVVCIPLTVAVII
jgi:hypothetical protein